MINFIAAISMRSVFFYSGFSIPEKLKALRIKNNPVKFFINGYRETLYMPTQKKIEKQNRLVLYVALILAVVYLLLVAITSQKFFLYY